MLIVITGTPGTGKSTIAKKISTLRKGVILEGRSLIKKYNLAEGKDNERDALIVDPKKFSQATLKEIDHLTKDTKKKTIIVDSHLSHELPPTKVDVCIVTTCGLPLLKKRLTKRKYSTTKIRENLDAEIFEVCLQEAKAKKHTIIIIDTSTPTLVKKGLEEIQKKLHGK